MPDYPMDHAPFFFPQVESPCNMDRNKEPDQEAKVI
jgi:hypothetical protein